MVSARVQSWALTLSAYDYKVQYIPGKENAVADMFSRLPLPVQPKQVPNTIGASTVVRKLGDFDCDCDPYQTLVS